MEGRPKGEKFIAINMTEAVKYAPKGAHLRTAYICVGKWMSGCRFKGKPVKSVAKIQRSLVCAEICKKLDKCKSFISKLIFVIDFVLDYCSV